MWRTSRDQAQHALMRLLMLSSSRHDTDAASGMSYPLSCISRVTSYVAALCHTSLVV